MNRRSLTTLLVEKFDDDLSAYSSSSSLPGQVHTLPAFTMQSLECRLERSSGLFSYSVAIGQNEPMAISP